MKFSAVNVFDVMFSKCGDKITQQPAAHYHFHEDSAQVDFKINAVFFVFFSWGKGSGWLTGDWFLCVLTFSSFIIIFYIHFYVRVVFMSCWVLLKKEKSLVWCIPFICICMTLKKDENAAEKKIKTIPQLSFSGWMWKWNVYFFKTKVKDRPLLSVNKTSNKKLKCFMTVCSMLWKVQEKVRICWLFDHSCFNWWSVNLLPVIVSHSGKG